jgi:hypothetical protein
MEDARPRGNPPGRSAWGAPLCCGSSEMSLHRLLAASRGASPGAVGAPEILGSPNPQAADRRKAGPPFKGGQHRPAKPAARARRDGAGRAPDFVSSLIRWFHHLPSLASASEALAAGRLSARCTLGQSRFKKARGGRAGGHAAEGRHGRCPAQGQPGGTPRPGRTAVSQLVADAPSIVLLTAPCRASQGAGVAPEIFPRSVPFIPASLRRDLDLFLRWVLMSSRRRGPGRRFRLSPGVLPSPPHPLNAEMLTRIPDPAPPRIAPGRVGTPGGGRACGRGSRSWGPR